jgi:hypothetical protein
MNNQQKLIFVAASVLLTVVARLLPHPANFTPVAAMALLVASFAAPAFATEHAMEAAPAAPATEVAAPAPEAAAPAPEAAAPAPEAAAPAAEE